MKYIGILLILLAAYFAARSYRRGARERRELAEGFLALISEMRRRAACYLEPPSRWVPEFVCPALEKAGFVAAVRSGKTLLEAFRAAKDGLPSERGIAELLMEFFSKTGSGYLISELELTEGVERDLYSKIEKLREDEERRCRSVGAVIYAVAVGAMLLLL